MKKRTKIIIAVLLIAIIIAGAFLARYFIRVNNYQASVANITYQSVGAENVPDGVYIGEHDADFIYAKVEVTVKDEKITNIDILEHRNEKGAAAESIVDEIISKQSLNVDAVSGATNSSKVITKAIDNALNLE